VPTDISRLSPLLAHSSLTPLAARPLRAPRTATLHALPFALVAVLAVGALPATALAAPPRLVGGGALSITEAPGVLGGVDARLVFDGGIQLGLAGYGGAVDRTYPGGQAERGAAEFGGRVLALFPLLEAGSLALDLRIAVGAMQLSVGDADPHDSATRLTTEVAMFARVALSSALTLRLGAVIGYDQEFAPTSEGSDQSQRLVAGLLVRPAPTWGVFGLVDAGGTFGFDGDSAKFLFRGEFGVRFTFDGSELPTAF